MQKDTKKLIYYTFIDLLEKKPFDRITVKDIVDLTKDPKIVDYLQSLKN